MKVRKCSKNDKDNQKHFQNMTKDKRNWKAKKCTNETLRPKWGYGGTTKHQIRETRERERENGEVRERERERKVKRKRKGEWLRGECSNRNNVWGGRSKKEGERERIKEKAT